MKPEKRGGLSNKSSTKTTLAYFFKELHVFTYRTTRVFLKSGFSGKLNSIIDPAEHVVSCLMKSTKLVFDILKGTSFLVLLCFSGIILFGTWK